MKKPASNQFPILESLRQRWSPRAFSEKPVEKEKVLSLLEAARWAPSSRNEQPWRFVAGVKGDKTWEKIFETLGDWNQQWAGKAPVLVLNVAKMFYDYKHLPNDTAQYDTGQAVAMMVTEAVNQGLIGHQMGGFSAPKAVELFSIPEGYHPLSVTAFGYYGDPEKLPDGMKKSEFEERRRRPITDIVFSEKFGQSTDLI